MALPSSNIANTANVNTLVSRTNDIIGFVNTDDIGTRLDTSNTNIAAIDAFLSYDPDTNDYGQIDANKIGNGDVSNARFDLLAGLSGYSGSVNTAIISANTAVLDISVATGEETISTIDGSTTTKINANSIADRSVTNAAYQRLAGTNVMLSTASSYIQANGEPHTTTTLADDDDLPVSTLGAYFEYLNGRIELLGNYENVDAATIADGSVSNAEFGYLEGVTENIQNTLTDVNSSIAALGDLDETNNTVKLAASYIAGSGVSNTELVYINNLENSVSTSMAVFTKQVGSLDIADSMIPASVFAGGNVSNAEFDRLNGLTENLSTTFNRIDTITRSFGAISSGTVYVDASHIAGGNVSNTEFGRVDGVTSDVQTQINKWLASIKSAAVSGSIDEATLAFNVDPALIGNKDVSSTHFLNLRGLTGNWQTQMDAHENKLASLGSVQGNTVFIDASRIANGNVTNAELSTLNGITSTAIQAQLDNRADATTNVKTFRIRKSYTGSRLSGSFTNIGPTNLGVSTGTLNYNNVIGLASNDHTLYAYTTSRAYTINTSTGNVNTPGVTTPVSSGYSLVYLNWDHLNKRWISVERTGSNYRIVSKDVDFGNARTLWDIGPLTRSRQSDRTGFNYQYSFLFQSDEVTFSFDGTTLADGFLYFWAESENKKLWMRFNVAASVDYSGVWSSTGNSYNTWLQPVVVNTSGSTYVIDYNDFSSIYERPAVALRDKSTITAYSSNRFYFMYFDIDDNVWKTSNTSASNLGTVKGFTTLNDKTYVLATGNGGRLSSLSYTSAGSSQDDLLAEYAPGGNNTYYALVEGNL